MEGPCWALRQTTGEGSRKAGPSHAASRVGLDRRWRAGYRKRVRGPQEGGWPREDVTSRRHVDLPGLKHIFMFTVMDVNLTGLKSRRQQGCIPSGGFKGNPFPWLFQRGAACIS